MRRSPGYEPFEAAGIPRPSYFDYEVVCIQKQYPGGLLTLTQRGFSPTELADITPRQLNVYSRDLYGLPEAVFTDPTVHWNSQQFGRLGLVAAAGICISDGRLLTTSIQSDLSQRLFRHPELNRKYGRRIRDHFGGWYKIVLNAILDRAKMDGLDTVCIPTAHESRSRIRNDLTNLEFLAEVYDHAGLAFLSRKVLFRGAEYWEIRVNENRERYVPLVMAADTVSESGHIVCVYHDVEEDIDTDVPVQECREHLSAMLAIERRHGVRATYNVLGTLFAEKAAQIVSSGRHALGFHTFDHRLDGSPQLVPARRIDLQVKGYRPARSTFTPDVDDFALSFHNFEWLMSSAKSFGRLDCVLENGIVKIPAHLDDYSLHTGRLSYEAWETKLLDLVRERRFVAVGLHDCYGRHWIDRYDELLTKLHALAQSRTAEEVTSEVCLRCAVD